MNFGKIIKRIGNAVEIHLTRQATENAPFCIGMGFLIIAISIYYTSFFQFFMFGNAGKPISDFRIITGTLIGAVFVGLPTIVPKHIFTFPYGVLTYSITSVSTDKNTIESKVREIFDTNPNIDINNYQGQLNIRVIRFDRSPPPPPSPHFTSDEGDIDLEDP